MDIKIEKLNKKYSDKVIFDNFDVVFESRKISVVMGKSGEGKTTLLNCIAKLTDYGGMINGVESISYLFQSDRLIPFKTVYENLDFTLDAKIKKQERSNKIKNILHDVSLDNKIFARISELSGGQCKRVSIARAFLADTDVMLMDEPLNSLDLGLRMQTIKLLLDMVGQYPRTVIYVTHDIDEALMVADCIFVIGENKIKYTYEFESSANERDFLSDECQMVKRQLIKLLI